MTLLAVQTSTTWINLDAWSNFYVGAHWLATEELPDAHWQTEPRHGPLSQLLLIASQHLVEFTLLKCVSEVLETNPGKFPDIERKFSRASFFDAFARWPVELTGQAFDTNVEPYKSLERLRLRRNDTAHKASALTSLEMARSALFSAVEGSKSIALHFRGSNGFPYEPVLKKYPLRSQKWFSDVDFIERLT